MNACRRTMAALLLAALLPACGASHQCCPQPGTCGLTLGEPVSSVKRNPNSRAEYYAGVASIGAGLTSLGVGTGYALSSGRYRDEADAGGPQQNLLLDKADAHDERASVGIGLGVPLVLIGAVLLWLRPPEEEPRKLVPVQAEAGQPGEILPGEGAPAAEPPAPVKREAQIEKPK